MTEAVHDVVPRSGVVLRLFGGFELSIDGEPVAITTKKSRWLLALLAFKAGREVERDWLATLLWPDSDENASRYNLRRTLSDLKSEMGVARERLKNSGSRCLILDLQHEPGYACADAFCDVTHFDRMTLNPSAHSLEELEASIDLYRGILLEGCQEDWVYSERLCREQQYLNALEVLAERYATAGRFADVAQITQRALLSDPFRESLLQQQLRALFETGDYAALQIAYRDFRIHLHAEMGIEPSPETQQLYQALRQEATNRAQPNTHTYPTPNAQRPNAPIPTNTPNTPERPTPSAQRPTPPQPTTALPPPGNLPRPVSALIGRRETIAEVASFLKQHPLVTLLGPGGVGKTRMALEVGQEVRGEYEDGVWFADLSALACSPHDEAGVLSLLMQVFRLKEAPSLTPLQSLQEALFSKELLLVLDNCEHLLPAVPRIARQLLEHCPRLTLLATSRQSLAILGEQLIRIACLDVPPTNLLDSLPSAQDDYAQSGSEDRSEMKNWAMSLLEYDAVRMFVERVRLSQSQIVWNSENVIEVARICVALDGLPLALELAAARAKAMSLSQIDARIQHRFRLLRSGNESAPARQQTLRALLDWSYDLLSPAERLVLHRLSVFTGSWSLEAAEAICADTSDAESDATNAMSNEFLDTWDILDLLLSLIDKSLVVYEERRGTPRYRLLETVREYAGEQLAASQDIRTLQRKHRDYYVDWVRTTWQMPVAEGVRLIDANHSNLIAALDFSLADPEGGMQTLKLANGLQRFWEVQGRFSEARNYYRRASEHPGADPYSEAMLRTLTAGANMARLTSDYSEAEVILHRVRVLAQEANLLESEVDVLVGLTTVALIQGRHGDARPLCAEAIALCREHNFKTDLIYCLLQYAHILKEEGTLDAARDCCLEAMALGSELGEQRAEYEGCLHLGSIYLCMQDDTTAQSYFLRALALYEEIGSRGGEAAARRNLGDVALKRGETTSARLYYRHAIQLNLEIGYQMGLLGCLESLVNLGLAIGQTENAAILFGWVSHAVARLCLEDRAREHMSIQESLILALGTEAFQTLYTRGNSLNQHDATQIGMNI